MVEYFFRPEFAVGSGISYINKSRKDGANARDM
jgi:hypothetical protein